MDRNVVEALSKVNELGTYPILLSIYANLCQCYNDTRKISFCLIKLLFDRLGAYL